MHGPSSTSYVARPRININELAYNNWMTWHMKVSTFQNHANKDSAELADLSKCLTCPESVLQSVKVKSSQKKKRKVKVKTVIWAQTSFVSTIKIIIPPTIFFFNRKRQIYWRKWTSHGCRIIRSWDTDHLKNWRHSSNLTFYKILIEHD